MKRMLRVLVAMASMLGTPAAPGAEPPTAAEQSVFSFQLEPTTGHRGVAVQGYVYNASPWRITNVRLQVDSVDATGVPVASASGWVLGDVAPGGRGYFYVPVTAPATTYRASVQAFDKVAREAPTAQAP